MDQDDARKMTDCVLVAAMDSLARSGNIQFDASGEAVKTWEILKAELLARLYERTQPQGKKP